MKFRDLIASIREKSIEHEKDIMENSENKEEQKEESTNHYNEVAEEDISDVTAIKRQRRKK